MEQKHTPEPWKWEAYPHEGAADGAQIFTAATIQQTPKWSSPTYIGVVYQQANARRIVACVNACIGIDDPAEEIAQVMENVRLASQQRDEIANVLRELMACKALKDSYGRLELADRPATLALYEKRKPLAWAAARAALAKL